MSKKSGKARLLLAVASVGSLSSAVTQRALAGAAYWDVNGTTAGAVADGVTVATAPGTWDASTANWNTDSTGGAGGAIGSWVAGDIATFSAGTNATTNSTIQVIGNQTVGGFDFQEGAITLTNSGTFTLTGTPSIAVASGNTPTIFNVISGTARWTKTGPGTLDIRATNLNTGGVTLNGGITVIGNGNSYAQLGDTPTTATVPDWLQFGGGTLKVVNTSSTTLIARKGITINSGGGTIDVAGGATMVVNSVIAGTGSLTKKGDSILQLAGASTAWSGGLVVNKGLVLVAGAGGLGSATNNITLDGGGIQHSSGSQVILQSTRTITIGAAGGTFDATGAGTWTCDASLSGSGVVTKNGNNILNLTAANSGFSGKFVVNAGELNCGNIDSHYGTANASDVITLNGGGGCALRSSADVTISAGHGITLGANGGQLDAVTSGTMTIASVITSTTGTGPLTKIGAQPVVLAAANDYAGDTTVSVGTLKFGIANALPSGAGKGNLTVTSTLDLNGFSGAVNGLSGAGTVTNAGGGASSLSVGANNQSSTFTGSVGNSSGTLAISKVGSGTVALTGTNTFTGGTTVFSGKLQVRRLQENNAVSITSNISGSGTLQVLDSSPTLPNFPSGDNAFVSRPSSLAIVNDGAPLGTRTYNGTLDLTNNDLILDYTGSSPFADIADMVRSGFNFGDWLGKGITSSTAANPLSNGNFALGVAENGLLTNPFGNDDPNDPNSLNPKFDGQTVDNTTVLVKFTHRVDLDLNGLVDGNDAAIFNGSFSEGDGGATWQTGDVDYDGVYSSNDAAIFNSFYDESLGHLPEPGALSLLAVVGVLASRRGRRHSI